MRKIDADFQRSADTHHLPLSMPEFPGVDVYRSLKHRLVRSLSQMKHERLGKRVGGIAVLSADDTLAAVGLPTLPFVQA